MKFIKTYYFTFGLIFVLGNIWSQKPIIHQISNPQDTFHFETNRQAFLFVCPTDVVNTDSVFFTKASSLIKSDKRLKIAEVHLLFYKPSLSAKKFNALSISGLDSIIKLEGILQCFAVNFPCDRVDSTLSRANLKNKYWFINYNNNVTEAIIYDNMCPQNLGERLFYYNDMMKELISPKYSEKEEIEFLKSRIFYLENALMKMQEQMEKLVPAENKENTINEEESKKKKKFNWLKE
jgi:hypothetical protein